MSELPVNPFCATDGNLLSSFLTLGAMIPLASMAISFYSPRVGMYFLPAIPTFTPSRLGRLFHPAADGGAGATSEEP